MGIGPWVLRRGDRPVGPATRSGSRGSCDPEDAVRGVGNRPGSQGVPCFPSFDFTLFPGPGKGNNPSPENRVPLPAETSVPAVEVRRFASRGSARVGGPGPSRGGVGPVVGRGGPDPSPASRLSTSAQLRGGTGYEGDRRDEGNEPQNFQYKRQSPL